MDPLLSLRAKNQRARGSNNDGCSESGFRQLDQGIVLEFSNIKSIAMLDLGAHYRGRTLRGSVYRFKKRVNVLVYSETTMHPKLPVIDLIKATEFTWIMSAQDFAIYLGGGR